MCTFVCPLPINLFTLIKFLLLSITLSLFSIQLNAQLTNISGVVKDKADKQPVLGVNLQLLNQDNALVAGQISDLDGNFKFINIPFGLYQLKVSFIGYETVELEIRINSQEPKILEIQIEQTALNLKTMTVEGSQIRMEQKGDTSQYNADAFKTNVDASAEELITKMPGISTEGGTVKAGGEDVKRVLVDGKPFFGDDPNLALKNLPADVIDKIQVFEQMSDQSQFTGFDDGRGVKTINIVTKAGKNNGQFGKIYAGIGEGNTYNAGGNINYFKGNRRISILGLANNINQQNFSTEDIVGALGAGGSNRSGMPGGGGRGRRNSGGGDVNDFLVNQSGGIAETRAFGLNYSDQWSKKIKVSGSYFFNQSEREYRASLFRDFIVQTDSSFTYRENSRADNLNDNHRVNFRLEFEIDSSQSIIVIPRLSLQQNRNNEQFEGQNFLQNNLPISLSATGNLANNLGYNFENTILYRYKFKKPRRTMSLSVTTEWNAKTGDGALNSINDYYLTGLSDNLDQISDLNNNGYKYSSDLSYTEPIGKHSQLQLSYNPSYTYSLNNKNTFNRNPESMLYSDLDSNLSNNFNNVYEAHQAGASFRYNKDKINFMLRASGQVAFLRGNQEFPLEFSVNRRFINFLPRVMFNYKFSPTKNLRMFYRTSANAPSVNQLQNVIDNRNPLFLSTGNPDLRQSVNHFIVTRYGGSNPDNARNTFFYVMLNFIDDYVGNSTIIANSDTIIQGNTILRRGSQFTQATNLSGFFNTRAFATFGLPVKALKSNLNFTEGFNYNRTPALINGNLNMANNYNFSQGLVLSSNISEKIDFNIGYTANYAIVRNSLQVQSDNNYFSHNASFRFNYVVAERLVFNTQVSNTLFSGLSADFNQNFTLLNMALAYKLLKNKSLEAKISVYDLLNQNNSIARTVTETFIEDVESNVLNRFLMFTLTWNIRNFGGIKK